MSAVGQYDRDAELPAARTRYAGVWRKHQPLLLVCHRVRGDDETMRLERCITSLSSMPDSPTTTILPRRNSAISTTCEPQTGSALPMFFAPGSMSRTRARSLTSATAGEA